MLASSLSMFQKEGESPSSSSRRDIIEAAGAILSSSSSNKKKKRMRIRVLLVCASGLALQVPPRSLRLPTVRYAATTETAREEFKFVGADGKEVELSLKEKERIFLDSLQSYYASGYYYMSFFCLML